MSKKNKQKKEKKVMNKTNNYSSYNQNTDDKKEVVKSSIKIKITPNAKEKLDAYIQNCDIEISGLGEVQHIKDSEYLITDIFLFKQKGSAAETELDLDDLSVFMEKYITDGNCPSKLKLWWHSHAKMSVFWSGTDETTADIFKGSSDWMISIVGNHKGEYLCRTDIYNPLRVTVDKLPIYLEVEKNKSLEDEIKQEIKDKVTTNRVVVYTPNSNNGVTYSGEEFRKKWDNYEYGRPPRDNKGLVEALGPDSYDEYGNKKYNYYSYVPQNKNLNNNTSYDATKYYMENGLLKPIEDNDDTFDVNDEIKELVEEFNGSTKKILSMTEEEFEEFCLLEGEYN